MTKPAAHHAKAADQQHHLLETSFAHDLQNAIQFRASNKMAGDCPDFAQSAEQNGTVPLSVDVLLGAIRLVRLPPTSPEGLGRGQVPQPSPTFCSLPPAIPSRTEGAWQASPGQARTASAALGDKSKFPLHTESVRQRIFFHSPMPTALHITAQGWPPRAAYPGNPPRPRPQYPERVRSDFPFPIAPQALATETLVKAKGEAEASKK